jgi:catechol 2,3-dioxygenase-like lactoylglutathione lyase family enzyme
MLKPSTSRKRKVGESTSGYCFAAEMPRIGLSPNGLPIMLPWTTSDSGRILPIDTRRHQMSLADAPIAHEGFFATHFFTVRDQEKSKDFYVRILGGKVIKAENPCYIKLANTWIILNSGGGPTPDKPEVVLETPSDLNRVNSFLNLRVADIWVCYKQWGDKGACFLTEPLDNHGWEWRCYMRDPDGYLIEVGQYTQVALDHFKKHGG